MKDLPLRPVQPGVGADPADPPVPGTLRMRPPQGSPGGPPLGRDTMAGPAGRAASGFAPADPVAAFPAPAVTLPAAGSQEAALLKDMDDEPGLPPQWREAFLQLPAADRRTMAQMYQQFSPQGRSSFLHDLPADREAMGQAFGRMEAAQRAAFLRLTPGLQAATGQLVLGMTAPAKGAFMALPAADQGMMAKAFRGLDGPAQKAFLRLSSDQQIQFAHVWAETGRVELGKIRAPEAGTAAARHRTGADGSTAVVAQEQLSRLLLEGHLTQAGPNGQTVLGALDRMRTVPLALPPGTPEPGYRQMMFNQLLTQIDAPNGIRQGNYNTCGATVAQRMFARENPADYAHFVVGLLSREAKGKLPDGTVLGRPADTLVPQTPSWTPDVARDNRNQIERVVQSALMNVGSPTSYSNSLDSNTFLGIGVAAGLSGDGIAKLLRAVRHRPTEVLPSDHFLTVLDGGWQTGVSRPSLLATLDAQLQRDPNQTVVTEVHFNPSGSGGSADLHWVEVSRMTADRVYYLNPHGNSFPYPPGQAFSGLPVDPGNGKHYITTDGKDGNPPRRLYEDGSESVERAWFDHSLEEILVDPDLRARAKEGEPRDADPF